MNKLLLLIALCCFHTSFAQEHLFGFNIGGSMANIKRTGFDFYNPVAGLTFDGNYTFRYGKFFTRSSLGFQHKGYSLSIIYVDEQGNILGEGGHETTRFSYLEGAQVGGIQFGNKIYGYAAFGIWASYYLQTRVKAAQFELDNGALASAYDYTFHNIIPLDLGGVFESGVGVHVDEFKEVVLIGSYNHGMIQTNYREIENQAPWSNRYFSVRLGFRFRLLEKEEKPVQE